MVTFLRLILLHYGEFPPIVEGIRLTWLAAPAYIGSNGCDAFDPDRPATAAKLRQSGGGVSCLQVEKTVLMTEVGEAGAPGIL